MNCLVKLRDENWYPCELLGESSATDYEGVRYTVMLSQRVKNICIDGHPFGYEYGHKFVGCHRECVTSICPECSQRKTIEEMQEAHGICCRECDGKINFTLLEWAAERRLAAARIKPALTTQPDLFGG